MPTIAIGDIHGNSAALQDLLTKLTPEISPADTVVFLGDYIDRGPNTRERVDAILAFQQDVAADVVCLCGNHEDWLLGTRADYRQHTWLLATEAFATIESYSAEACSTLRESFSNDKTAVFTGDAALPYDLFFDRVPDSHIRFFKSLRLYHQSPDCVCVHGGLDPTVPALSDQTRHALVWGASGFPRGYQGQHMVVYGHRNNAILDPDGWPRPAIVGRTIGIDTIAHGVLTAIRMPDQAVFQSGKYRLDGPGPRQPSPQGHRETGG